MNFIRRGGGLLLLAYDSVSITLWKLSVYILAFCYIFVIKYGAVIIVDILRTKVFILVKLIDCSKAICKITDNPGPLSTIFQKSFEQTPWKLVPLLGKLIQAPMVSNS